MRAKNTEQGRTGNRDFLMRHYPSRRNIVVTVFFSILAVLFLNACGDTNNVSGPPGPGALTITTSSPLPSGSIGIAYSTTLTASGGEPPYAWSLAAGSSALPTGLSLSKAGVISGTPRTIQTAAPIFIVQDSTTPTPQADQQTLTIAINAVPQPSITAPTLLLSGIVGKFYSETLTAAGGTQPYTTWSVTPPLPTGLSLTPNGNTATVTGSLAVPYNKTHTFSVTDSFSPTPQVGTRNYTLTFTNAPLTLLIRTTSLAPDGTAFQPYNRPLAAQGGTPPLTWSISNSSPNPLPAGLSLTAGGLLSGTTTSAVNTPVRFRVQDGGTPVQSDEKTLTITINLPAPPTITTTFLPNGSFNNSYNQTLKLNGGIAPLNWGVIVGGLPPGLGLNASTGQILGTAAQTGTFPFTVQVTDAISRVDTQALSITITAPAAPAITAPASLPTGTVTQRYPDTTLRASGGTAPLTWDPVVNPALPNGLSWDAATHTISGTPLNGSQGTANHTFTVRDSTNPVLTATRTYSLSINLPAPPNITTTSASLLPNGTVTKPYSRTVQATGGTGALTWSISAGSLPTGLNPINPSTGQITGTPSVAGKFDFTVQATDTLNQSDTQALSITIDLPAPPNITTTSPLPNGIVGTPGYSEQVQATGGIGNRSWTIVSPGIGPLPPGLDIDPSTGVISGEPTTAGTYNFTVQVTDTIPQSDTQDFTITIN
jgi:hypothetical protein